MSDEYSQFIVAATKRARLALGCVDGQQIICVSVFFFFLFCDKVR